MPYNREYTRAEVHDILAASERRHTPGRSTEGHPISRHADGRKDIFDRRNTEPVDGRFLSRKDLILAVTEALNSPAGQAGLATLSSADSVAIDAAILLYQGKLRAEVVRNPFYKPANKAKVPAEGPPFYQAKPALGVKVIVHRLQPITAECGIHILTAYPTF